MRYVRESFDTPNVMQQDQNVRINYKNSVTTTTTVCCLSINKPATYVSCNLKVSKLKFS